MAAMERSRLPQWVWILLALLLGRQVLSLLARPLLLLAVLGAAVLYMSSRQAVHPVVLVQRWIHSLSVVSQTLQTRSPLAEVAEVHSQAAAEDK